MRNKKPRPFHGGAFIRPMSFEEVYELGKMCFDLKKEDLKDKEIVVIIQEKFSVFKRDLSDRHNMIDAEMSVYRFIKNFKSLWFDRNYKE